MVLVEWTIIRIVSATRLLEAEAIFRLILMSDQMCGDMPVLVGICRPVSYTTALEFARRVTVPFRLVLSQRLLASREGNDVAALLAGGRVTFPRLRRDAYVFADALCVPELLDCAERAGLFDTWTRLPEFRCLRGYRYAKVRWVFGHRHPLSASFFRSECSYDLVLDLFPVREDAFTWRGGCFSVGGLPGVDNIPLWASRSDGSLSSADLAGICAASRRFVC